MTKLLVLICLFAAPVLALCAFIKLNPGAFGEWLLHVMLVAKLDKARFRVLRNVMLPTDDGATTQIDHIVVCAGGVFVIETKTYGNKDTRTRPGSCWIFGTDFRSRGGDSRLAGDPFPGTQGRPCRNPSQELSAEASAGGSARIRRTGARRRGGSSRLSEVRCPDGPSHPKIRRRLVLGLLRLSEMPRNPRCSTNHLTRPRPFQP